MDERALMRDLPALDPGALTGRHYLGVDEVARAKGQDYLTIVYDLDSGDLVWVVEGRSKAGLLAFFDRIDKPVVQGTEAVAMDMWALFQAAVREALPCAAIVFDRFHVMQQYSKVIDSARRAEFKRASKANENVLVGSRYLLLENVERLNARQHARRVELLAANAPLNAVYSLKEQLQQLGHASSVVDMTQRLDARCELADATNLPPHETLCRDAATTSHGPLQRRQHRITTARLEGGHVASGLIRKRARGLLDTHHFKLKIRQSAMSEPPPACMP